MKREGKVEEKLRDLRYEHLKSKMEENLTPVPENCKHNYQYTAEDDDGEEVTVGLCMLGSDNPQEWPGNVCDAPQTAEKCPFFEPKKSEEELKEEFRDEIDRGEYPDLTALQWVLDRELTEMDWTVRRRMKASLHLLLLRLNWFFRCFYGAS